MLCDYGCEQEAKFKLKNGSLCCSEHFKKCRVKRDETSKSKIGKKLSDETKEKIRKSNIGKIRTDETKQNISKSHKGQRFSEEQKNKLRGKPSGNKGNIYSEESRKKMSVSHLGKKYGPMSDETKRKIGKGNNGKIRSEITKRKLRDSHIGKKPSEKCREINRQKLLNGQAAYMNKCIKNPSKPEVMLRKMVKDLYPSCENQYSVFNYSLDVAIPECKIAIEYDGWYHFNSEENKEYHKMRQQNIEKEGWKFIRYNIFQKFPTLEKLKEDILKLLI